MPRKGENIYKRKDGRWEGRYIRSYDAENKAKYAYVYFRSSVFASSPSTTVLTVPDRRTLTALIPLSKR